METRAKAPRIQAFMKKTQGRAYMKIIYKSIAIRHDNVVYFWKISLEANANNN